MEDRLLDTSVVAKRLNVSSESVRRYVKDPNHPLRGVRLGKKLIKVYSSSVEETLLKRKMC